MCEAGGSSGNRFKQLSSNNSFLQIQKTELKKSEGNKEHNDDRATKSGDESTDKTICGAKCLTKPKVL
jgi:hypothetical protein